MGARNSSITGNSDNNTVYGNITQERDLSNEGIQHSPLQTQSNDPMMTNASPSVPSTPSGILTSRIKDISNVPTLNHSMEVSTMSPPTTASYTDWLYSTAAANPYFHAGAGLYSLTVAAVICRYGFQMVLSALKRRYVVSMEMTNRDVSHDWMMQWMARNPSFSFQQVSVITKDVTIHANEESTSNCSFAPCPNVPHWFMHNGWPIVVYRKRQVERAAGSDVLEMLELYTLGRSKTIMEEIVKEAKKQAIDRDSDKTIIYQNAGGRWIRNQGERARRPMNSVVLAGNSRDALVEDVKLFLQSHSYYQNLGVPYRRGYLLHGPPGCGKSSFVMALAGELRLAICLLSLSNRALDDESLNSLLNSAPLCSIVLMEDIDRAFCNESRVTMSGVLNALDGVAAQEGRLVFMTTNHVERLDAALIRPGRADIKMEIGLLRRKQAKDIFSKFFPKCSEETQERFAATLPDGVVSVAQIQSHLFLHRNSAEDAVNALPDFLNAIMEFDEKIEKAREMDRRIREVKNPKFVHEMGLYQENSHGVQSTFIADPLGTARSGLRGSTEHNRSLIQQVLERSESERAVHNILYYEIETLFMKRWSAVATVQAVFYLSPRHTRRSYSSFSGDNNNNDKYFSDNIRLSSGSNGVGGRNRQIIDDDDDNEIGATIVTDTAATDTAQKPIDEMIQNLRRLTSLRHDPTDRSNMSAQERQRMRENDIASSRATQELQLQRSKTVPGVSITGSPRRLGTLYAEEGEGGSREYDSDRSSSLSELTALAAECTMLDDTNIAYFAPPVFSGAINSMSIDSSSGGSSLNKDGTVSSLDPFYIPSTDTKPYVPGTPIIAPGYTRYRVDVQYQGSDFDGWFKSTEKFDFRNREQQSKSNSKKKKDNWLDTDDLLVKPRAKRVLEDALAVALDIETVSVHAAVVPESGVHVRRLSCHLDIPSSIEMQPRTVIQRATMWLERKGGTPRGSNSSVGAPLAILSLYPCKEQDFDARYSALRRIYAYRISNRIAPPLFDAGLQWHVDQYLDVARMNRFASEMMGTRDFGAFIDPKMGHSLRKMLQKASFSGNRPKGMEFFYPPPYIGGVGGGDKGRSKDPHNTRHAGYIGEDLIAESARSSSDVAMKHHIEIEKEVQKNNPLAHFNSSRHIVHSRDIHEYKEWDPVVDQLIEDKTGMTPKDFERQRRALDEQTIGYCEMTTRTVDRIDVVRNDDEVIIWFVGKSFMRHQIRNMVSVLKAAGQGLWDERELRIFMEKGFSPLKSDIKNRFPTAPVHGLTLWDTEYDESYSMSSDVAVASDDSAGPSRHESSSKPFAATSGRTH